MDKQELQDWGQQLDAGNIGDPTLELAAQLSAHRSPAARPPARFKQALKSNLLLESRTKTVVKSSRVLRWGIAITVAVFLAVGVFAGLNPIIQEPQPVSAAEILARANQAYISQTQSDEILHTKFSLSWGPFMWIKTVGEQWLHTDGNYFRSQLANKDGILFYFSQSNGEIVWRSVHKQEIGSMPVYSVYALSPEQYTPLYLIPLNNFVPIQGIAGDKNVAPLFGDISDWLEMDQWILLRGEDCEDLYCLLGLADSAEWECDGSRCTLPLQFPLLDAPGANLEVRVTGTEETTDGRSAFIMEFRTDRNSTLLRTLKFDTETFALLEILAHRKNDVSGKTEVSARMTYTLREFLPLTEELLATFSIVPESLKIIPYEEKVDLTIPQIPYSSFNHPPQGSIPILPVVHGVSPTAGKTLSGRVEFEMRVSYDLGYAPEADLIVRLCESYSMQSDASRAGVVCVNELAYAQVRISEGNNTKRFIFTLDVDETWPEHFSLMIEIIVDEEIYVQWPAIYGPWFVKP